jgi:hypothetical protein
MIKRIAVSLTIGLLCALGLTAFLRDPAIFATNQWSYAAATNGITNSNTAVTIKTAGGAAFRNYVSGCTIGHATLGATTEFAIRDGAAGTVLWRTILNTTAMPTTGYRFDPPLKGTANTLVEIITLTAVTGAVLVNCQGYIGP